MTFLGHILDVDLSAGKWNLSPYPTELIWKILGGRGFNAWFLYQNIPTGTDPLDRKNILIFSCGVLTGTAAPASSRLHIGALSPLTGLLGSSNVGGDFGAKLRSAGIQSLIIRGRASKPVYLLIDGDRVEILDAKVLWGMDTWETQECIRNELGHGKPAIVAIGPGGENGARFACIMSDRDHSAGRTGMGAVMGSKNLKAVVIEDKKKSTVSASRRSGRNSIKRYLKQIKSSPEFANVTKYGGAGYVKWADEMGILATRNYRENHFEGVDRLDGKRLEKYITRSRGCHRCPVRCKAELEFTNGRFKGTNGIRPEFEPMISLGSKCGLSDLEEVVFLDNLCSRLGLDNISAGSAIAFAMDLWERGILTLEDTSGLQKNIHDMMLDWLAAGLDPRKSILFVQSHVPEVMQLHTLLSMVTPLSWLLRVPTFKEKIKLQPHNVNYGLVGYPVLMTADIVLYKAEAVPVGEDQLTHLELAREIARRFNSLFGYTFPEPEAKLTSFPLVLGLDGKDKMSKQADNDIELALSPQETIERVMMAVTDPARRYLSDLGHPEICNVNFLHGYFHDFNR